MFDRITEMSLTLDEEYMQSSSTFGGRVRLMGAPDDYEYYAGGYSTNKPFDAQIVEASGLEMPEIIVFGGDLYGGGSKFTGTRMADREIDLTLLPVDGTTPSEVKSKLSALAGASARVPLTLRITLFQMEDVYDYEHPPAEVPPPISAFDYSGSPLSSVWETKVYISNITSPIFSDSSEVNVTLSMGDTLFTRADMLKITGQVKDGADKSGFSDLRRTDTIFRTPEPSRIIYKSVLLSSRDLDVVGAPSPGSIEAVLRFKSKPDFFTVFVDDYTGGNIRYVTGGGVDAGTEIPMKYDPERGRILIGHQGEHYVLPGTVSGKLPMFRPSRDSFRVGVEVPVNYRDVEIDVKSALIAPGRYGF